MGTQNNKKLPPILILTKDSSAIEKALVQQVYPILIAKDEAEALTLYQTQQAVLLILDDITICKQACKAMGAVILMICDSEKIDAALAAGATDCYIGSIHPRLLKKRVNYLLQSKTPTTHDTELALQESEVRYQSLFEAANDGILLIDVMTAKIIEANPQATRMLGYTHAELCDTLIQEIEHKAEHETQKVVAYKDSNRMIEESLFKRQDGSMMPVETSSRLMLFNGQPTIISFLRDISKRKQVFEAEQEQRQFAEALLDTTAALNKETELDAVLDAILRNISRVLPVECANIMLLEDGWVSIAKQQGYKEAGLDEELYKNLRFEIKYTTDLIQVIQNKKGQIINDIDTENIKWANPKAAAHAKSLLTAPIMLGQKVIGFINLDSTHKNRFLDEHLHKLQAFANQAAVAIQNAHLFKQIQTHMDKLESSVIERTSELSKANIALREQNLQRQEIEDKLEEERTLLRILIDNIPDQVYVKDKKGKILLANQAAKLLMLQAGNGDIPTNQNFSFALDTKVADIFHEQEMEIMQRGEAIVDFEASYQEADGEQRWILTTKVPLRDGQNDVIGLVGINRDITDLKKIQTQLAEERTLLRTIIDTIPDSIYVKDIEGRFVLVNAAILFNKSLASPDDILAKTDYAFFSEDIAQRFEEEEANILATGNSHINQLESFIGEDGSWYHILVTKLPLRDSQGNITGLIGINHDISELKRAEAQLEQVLRGAQCLLWSATIEQTEDGHFIWDIRVANEEAAQGFLPLDISENNYTDAWQAAILPEDRERRDYVFETHLRFNSLNYNQEFRVILRDGFEHWLAEEILIQESGQGRWYAVGVCTDISERKEAERHLREVNQELEQRVQERTRELTAINNELRQEVLERKRAEEAERNQRILADTLRENVAKLTSTLKRDEVFDHLLNAIKLIVPYDGANIMLLEDNIVTIARTYGYDVDLIDKAHLIEEYPDLVEVLETSKPFYIPNTAEYEHWKNFENLDWIKSNLSVPIKFEDKTIGFLTCDSAMVDDFTDEHAQWLLTFASQAGIAIHNANRTEELEKRVQDRTQDLALEKAQLRVILDSIRDGVMYTNMEQEVQYINHSLHQITGYSEEEWLSNLVNDNIRTQSPEELAEIREKIKVALAKQGYWRGQALLRRKDKSTFDGELTRTWVRNIKSEPTGTVTVVRDISDEKRLEEQKKRFIAIAAHELRTPIANMKTRLFLMRRKPESFMEHIAVAESVVSLMQNLVEEMFDISRFERGVIRLEREKMILQNLFTEVMQYQQPEAERLQITLHAVLPETPIHIYADPYRLTQVIINLIGNALRYTPQNGEVRVEVEHIDDYVMLRVVDNGEGIAPENIKHLFEPFFRATTDQKGAGLGLAIVNEIVLLHGGTIEVESELGKGSSFNIKLPLTSLASKSENS